MGGSLTLGGNMLDRIPDRAWNISVCVVEAAFVATAYVALLVIGAWLRGL